MRRAPVVLTATVAGMAAVLGFHAHGPAPTAVAAAASTAGATASASGTTSSSAASSPSGTASRSKSVTGSAVQTRYGVVQVRVTVEGGKVTDVQAVALPQTDPRSSQISTYAAPLLRQSALAKQSASIDAVSGATYTSDGYAQSLQSALSQAGIA